MPRPIRIEYENACYHVMNRGRGSQNIFLDKDYFEAFLSTLAEAHQRFGIQILCYCLMDNHYHLLVKTPEANLGRAMRHINGVYTQRYNRLNKTDGSLFRGRYKAICVEEDSYQLQLSRYIHRNPLEAGIVNDLDDYSWSSYSFFLNRKKTPEWLYPKDIFDQLNVNSQLRKKYRAFVELGIDEEIATFYGKGNIRPYLGGPLFRDWIYKQKDTDELALTKETIKIFRPDIDEIVKNVANRFKVSLESIFRSERGRVKSNLPRWISIYLAQQCGGAKIKDIALAFGLKRAGSVSTIIKKLKNLMNEDVKLQKKIKRIKSEYDT